MLDKRVLILVVVFMLLVSCNGQVKPASQTETAQALAALNQSATQTALAAIPEATNTPAPAPATSTSEPRPASNCDPGQTLDTVRATLPVDEFAVHYNVAQGLTTLVIWSVNPDILVPVTEQQVSEMGDQAWVHAGRMAIAAVNASPCVRELFDAIDTIVVDSEYAGWISGQVRIADIPQGASSEGITDALLMVLDKFNLTYLRQAPVQAVPQGTCDWPEARQNIWSHFSPERQNIAFYYTIDEYGGNVWAQWDGPPDDAMFLASIMNVMLGLECFNPEANIIAMVVDGAGNMIKIGVVPQMDISRMQVQSY